MNKSEKEVLLNCSKRIKELASLEKASFSMNSEKDEQVKKSIKPYMVWFEIVAMYIDDLIELSEKKNDENCVKWIVKEDLKKLVEDSYRL